MSTFITRIELHDAVWADYDRLHAAMERVGFSRTLKGNDGVWYQLPTAEYWFEGTANLEAVYNTAKAAASTVGKAFNIITSQTTGSLFSLPPVRR